MIVLKTSNGRVIHEQEGELPGADLQGLTLRGVSLSHEMLVGCNFSRAVLTFAHFDDSDLRDALFVEAIMEGVSLYGANLEGANLQRANMYCVGAITASFRGANLEYAELQGADLKECDFSGAILTRVNLGLDNIGGSASLQGANFLDADVQGVRWEGAEYDDRTVFPKRFDPQKFGLIFKTN